MILGAISSTDKKDLRSAIHPDTIKYLLDMGIEPFLVVGSLNVVVAQRLCRKICSYCKE